MSRHYAPHVAAIPSLIPFIGLKVSRLRWSAPELRGGPELGVHLRGEPLCDGHLCVADFGVRLRNLGVEISPGLRRDDVGLALAILDHFRDAIPNPQHHVAMRYDGVPIHRGPVTRNDLNAVIAHRDMMQSEEHTSALQ